MKRPWRAPLGVRRTVQDAIRIALMEMAAGITRTTARRQGQSAVHVQTATGMQGDPHPPATATTGRRYSRQRRSNATTQPGMRHDARHGTEVDPPACARPGGWTAHRAIVRFRRRHPRSKQDANHDTRPAAMGVNATPATPRTPMHQVRRPAEIRQATRAGRRSGRRMRGYNCSF